MTTGDCIHDDNGINHSSIVSEEINESTSLLPKYENVVSKWKVCTTNSMGFILVGFSSILFSLMTVFVHSLSRLASMEIMIARQMFQTCFSLFMLLCIHRHNPLKPYSKLHWMLGRGFLGSCAIASYMYALTTLPLGNGVVVFFTFPISTGLFASLFLNEPFSWGFGIASLLSLVGVFMVAQPPFIFGAEQGSSSFSEHWPGYLFAFIGSLCVSLSLICVRKGGKEVPTMNYVFWFGLIGLILSPIALFIIQTPVAPEGIEYLYLVLVCVLGVCGQIVFIKGVQLEKVGPTQILRNFDIVFAFIFQVTVFHEKLSLWSVGGSLLILASVTFIVVHNFIQKKKKINEIPTQQPQPESYLSEVDPDLDFIEKYE